MEVIRDMSVWRRLRRETVRGTLGFVPTMGALHEGHASLLERCRLENDISVLSIFINPTQFNNATDLEKYPVTYEADVELAKTRGVDYIIYPDYPQLYPDGYRYRVTENSLSAEMEGSHRPGHFDGVLSVVMKLLNLVKADRAYFGEKDYQQLKLVKEMADTFFMDVQIVPCPTVRESDGLAMSSRNVRLSAEARRLAPMIAKLLRSEQSPEEVAKELQQAGFEVDYIRDFEGRRFAAATIGGVRLIDNVER